VDLNDAITSVRRQKKKYYTQFLKKDGSMACRIGGRNNILAATQKVDKVSSLICKF